MFAACLRRGVAAVAPVRICRGAAVPPDKKRRGARSDRRSDRSFERSDQRVGCRRRSLAQRERARGPRVSENRASSSRKTAICCLSSFARFVLGQRAEHFLDFWEMDRRLRSVQRGRQATSVSSCIIRYRHDALLGLVHSKRWICRFVHSLSCSERPIIV